jgi:hypothetical protein
LEKRVATLESTKPLFNIGQSLPTQEIYRQLEKFQESINKAKQEFITSSSLKRICI